MVPVPFFAQGRIWKLAALLHAPRAAGREKSFPLLDFGRDVTVKLKFSFELECSLKVGFFSSRSEISDIGSLFQVDRL